jgi:predicted RNA polymerase sigma factor
VVNLGELHRREYGRILASLIRAVKDFDLAEDVLQEAFAAALAQWPAQGPPQNPVAWLISTSRHKALHAQAPSARATDWPQIAVLYSALVSLHPSPVVELNRAVAIAMADGLEHGLALLDTIHLPGYHLLPAARADLLRRLGRHAEAAAAYGQALALVTNAAERRFLERRLAEVTRPVP